MKSSQFDYIADATAVAFTAVQTNEMFQIISLVLTILCTALSMVYTIYKWYKNAKSDGHITKEEVKDGIEKVVQVITKDKDNGKE